MPIHKEGSGWQWGNHGKVYPTRAGAERQAEAAHANGFTGDHDEMCNCEQCKSKRTNDSVTASGFFSEEELSPNQYFTPEGFLVCEAVPVARTGVQEYADIELPDIEPGDDGLIYVERDPEVVFSPETIASLIGKPVTLDHPREPVTPDNWAVLAKGTTHNVRRGEGDQRNLLLADLLITDKAAINEVRNNGLKGISLGYESDYQQIAPGRARQATIVVNHTALVRSPRCGATCSIHDSTPSLGDPPMAVKKGAESLKDKLRKLFMTRDSEAFEKALSEEVKDDAEGMEKNMPDIHIHMPGAEKVGAGDTADADDPAAAGEGGNPAEQKIMAAIQALTETVTAIGERVAKLESGNTADADPADDPENDPNAEPSTNDADPDDKDGKTYDSASLRDEFQDAKARAEILAPGVKLPTFDAKSDKKKTTDSICVLRRRALKAALENDNAVIVKSVVGNADVSKMTCDAAAMAFNAASEMVKAKNKSASSAVTHDASKKSINQIHADFWANRKA